MRTYRDYYPTEHLTYHDLRGKPEMTVQIESVTEGERWNGTKREKCLLVNFVGKKKGLRLGSTINTQIAVHCGHGRDFDAWPGKWITLYTTTDPAIRGEDKNCLRVKQAAREAISKVEAARARAAAGGAAAQADPDTGEIPASDPTQEVTE